MRILITGATGLIGRQIAEQLFLLGHDLAGLSRSPARAAASFPFPCDFFGWDGLGEPPAEAFRGVEAVIHLAGENVGQRWTAETKKRIRSSRVEGTRSLMKTVAARGSGVRTVIAASAVGYYGDRGDARLTESAGPGEDFLAEVCRDWERELFEASVDARRVALRTGAVLSRDQGFLGRVVPVFESGAGGRIGSGRQWLSWIHIDDLVALYLAALDDPSFEGPINACSPEPVTNREFTRALAGVLRRPAVLPAPFLAVRAAFGEMSVVALGGQRVTPERASELGFEWEYRDIRAALGAECTVGGNPALKKIERSQWVPSGLDETFEFFKDERNLETITPPWLRFRVTGKSTDGIRKGTRIDYRLRLRGLPLKWRSRITHWEPGVRFTDEQVKGPYSVWHHTHRFQQLRGGTLLSDEVIYRLPGGPFGRVLSAKVASDLAEIFDYRATRINEIFTPRERSVPETDFKPDQAASL